MFVKISINSQEWNDLVFENKNHDYGAYMIRVNSSNRLAKSFLIATAIFVLAVFTPLLIKMIMPPKKMANLSIMELSTIKLDQPPQKRAVAPIVVTPPQVYRSSIKYVPPVIRPDEEVADNEKYVTQSEVLTSKAAVGVVDYKGASNTEGAVLKKNEEPTLVSNGLIEEKEALFLVVEQMPEFPGGEKELQKFISNSIRYPLVALENSVQGRVICEFVINRDGKVSDVKVIRGIDPSLDEEAIRVIKSMPHWKPGKQGGHVVKVRFTMPINFKLQ